MKPGGHVTPAKLTPHIEHTYFKISILEFEASIVLLNGIHNKCVLIYTIVLFAFLVDYNLVKQK